jgi:hypothetical protein
MKSLKTKIFLNIEQVIWADYVYMGINTKVKLKIQDAIVTHFQSNKPVIQILNQTYKMRIQNYE